MRFSSPTFRKSPLTLSVPLDGTDTVIGLSKLLQRRRVDALEERLGIPRGNAQPTRRYKGPYVSELSMQSLSQAPKPWPAFFMGEKSASSRATYTLPADTTMLLDRIEENLVFFLVNYLTILGAFGLHIMLQHPWSIAALLGVYFLRLRTPTGAQSVTAESQQAPVQGESAQVELGMSAICSLASYIIFLMSGASGAVLRCMPLILAVTLGHAALRTAASEYKAGAAVGVDFRDLWGGGRQGVRQGGDPWRLVKELWVALVEAGAVAASSIGNYISATLALARESVGLRHGPLAFGRAWAG